MFTGIVEEAGRVAEVRHEREGIGLSVVGQEVGSDAKVGDSVAVNGCCLTVVHVQSTERGQQITFDLLEETWQRTNLKAVVAGALVNLERSLPANGRIHGHFVTGHIDGTGKIIAFERRGADWYLKVQASNEVMRYLVLKGAIAVDGISLTVAEVNADSFAVWIIPHTYSVTALRERSQGSFVNLEADLLAKYVQKLIVT